MKISEGVWRCRILIHLDRTLVNSLWRCRILIHLDRTLVNSIVIFYLKEGILLFEGQCGHFAARWARIRFIDYS